MIKINILDGLRNVTTDDINRASSAAQKLLDAFEWRESEPMQIDPAESYAAYKRHVSDEDYYRSPHDTILIAAWEAAQSAADLALTNGWQDPDGAHCDIAAG